MGESETRLEEALRVVPRKENVHRRRSEQVTLDTALGDMSHYRNGRPFYFIVDGFTLQGRRTFIEIGEEEAQTVVTASTTDLRNAGDGPSRNPRARARHRGNMI